MQITLKNRLREGALRTLKKREGLIDLASNDILGLSADPSFQRAASATWNTWSDGLKQKTGSTGSRLLTGNHRFFEEIETLIAKFHGFNSATLFNCGYMANLALFSSLGPKDMIIADLGVHASIHDGIRLSKAKSLYFRHQNLRHLESRLQTVPGRKYVIIESLYSMGGSFSNLKEIVRLCHHYGAHLIVDETHTIGIYGNQGKGMVAESGFQEHVFACIGGFGKALGAHGAVILGSYQLKTHLINCARPFIYTTALPLSTLAAIHCSYQRIPFMETERAHIASLCHKFSFASHIHAIPILGNARAKLLSLYLSYQGFDLRPILSPTVPKGQEMVRLIVHTFNTEEEIDRCLKLISLLVTP